MITGKALVAGVVGWPVAHSLSPLIHNAWITALGLDAAYVPLAVEPDRFQRFMDVLRSGPLRGLNVTLPHKVEALAYADAASEAAVEAGAANLLVFDGERVLADNTDGLGLLAALSDQAPAWVADAGPCVVLGAGGAASGGVSALLTAGVLEVRVVARRFAAAAELADSFGPRVQPFDFSELSRALFEVTLVVNATSAGLGGRGGLPDIEPRPEAVIMDMVYAPLWTPFLRRARSRGHVTVDGLAMLIGQARPSFQAFFGVAPPTAVDVRTLCLEALGEA